MRPIRRAIRLASLLVVPYAKGFVYGYIYAK